MDNLKRILHMSPNELANLIGELERQLAEEMDAHILAAEQRNAMLAIVEEMDEVAHDYDLMRDYIGRLREAGGEQVDVGKVAELERLARCTVYAHYLALLQREAGDHSDGPRLMVESHLDALGELAGISTERLRDIYKDAPLLQDLLRAALEGKAEPCAHEWTDMTNKAIISGEWCPKCNAMRAAESDRGTQQSLDVNRHICPVTGNSCIPICEHETCPYLTGEAQKWLAALEGNADD